MSPELFLVNEDDNIPYEGTSWAIAGFTTRSAAEAWCVLHTAAYLEEVAVGVAQMRLAEAEIDALPHNLAGYSYELESLIRAKYPNARDEWLPKHFFYVAKNSLPLNPFL